MKYEGKVLAGSLSNRFMRSGRLVVKHETEDGEIEVYKWHHTFGYWMFQHIEEESPEYEIID